MPHVPNFSLNVSLTVFLNGYISLSLTTCKLSVQNLKAGLSKDDSLSSEDASHIFLIFYFFTKHTVLWLLPLLLTFF